MNIVLFVIVQVLILLLGCIHAFYILLKLPVVVPATYDLTIVWIKQIQILKINGIISITS